MSGRAGMVVLGAGRAGVRHARAALRVPSIELRGVYDQNFEAAERAAAELGVAAFRTLDDALAQDAFVSVCTPTGLHAGHALRAIDAGLHAIVEKPFDVDPARVDAVEVAAARAGVVAGAIAQHRFSDDALELRRRVRDGELGAIESVRVLVQRYRSPEFFTRSAGDWRLDRALSGGGVLTTIGFHYLDLACWIFGEPAGAEGEMLSFAGDIDMDVAGMFRFGAVRGSVHARWGEHEERPDVLEIAGTAGTAALRGDRLEGFGATRHDKLELHARQLADFAAAILERRPPAVAPRDVLPALRLISSLYESMEVRSR